MDATSKVTSGRRGARSAIVLARVAGVPGARADQAGVLKYVTPTRSESTFGKTSVRKNVTLAVEEKSRVVHPRSSPACISRFTDRQRVPACPLFREASFRPFQRRHVVLQIPEEVRKRPQGVPGPVPILRAPTLASPSRANSGGFRASRMTEVLTPAPNGPQPVGALVRVRSSPLPHPRPPLFLFPRHPRC